MYAHLTSFDTTDGIGASVPFDRNKWPAYRKAAASVAARLPKAGDFIERLFDEPQSFLADSESGLSYSMLRLYAAFYGVALTHHFRHPDDFLFTVTLYHAGHKLIEWLVPAHGGELSSFDFDLQPLIGAGETQFDRIRITAVKDNSVYVYLAGLYLADEDTEHSLKHAIFGLLHNKITPYLCTTAVRNDKGSEVLLLPADAPVRIDERLRIGAHDYVITAYNKTPEATEVSFTNEKEGKSLLALIPPGTRVYVPIGATYTDIADADAVYPIFYIQGSELPARDLLGAENSTTFNRGSFTKRVEDGATKYYVGIRRPDKAYKFDISIHVYAHDLDIANVMRKFLSATFDEDSFIEVAGEPTHYTFKGIDAIQEWDSIGAMPHCILRLEFSFSENLSVTHYQPFGLPKTVDFEIKPSALLLSSREAQE